MEQLAQVEEQFEKTREEKNAQAERVEKDLDDDSLLGGTFKNALPRYNFHRKLPGEEALLLEVCTWVGELLRLESAVEVVEVDGEAACPAVRPTGCETLGSPGRRRRAFPRRWRRNRYNRVFQKSRFIKS